MTRGPGRDRYVGRRYDRRQGLVAFLGVALWVVGAGLLGSELLGAVGVLVAAGAVLLWPYLRPALDRLQLRAAVTRTAVRSRLAPAADRVRSRLGSAVERTPGSGSDDGDDPTPVERLRERYAAGELTEAEFERRLETVLETDDERVAELVVED